MRHAAFIPTLAAMLLLGAGCASTPSSTPEATPPVTTPSPQDAVGPVNEEELPVTFAIEEGSIVMNENGFSPATITVPKGTLVVFSNKGSRPHWPASAVHPTHELLPGFDALRGIAPGESYSFTFTKAGTWKYHDHLNPSRTGSVTVTE